MRTRDGERVGKMRIDEVAKHFENLMPKKSHSFENLYSKVWRPEDYPAEEKKQEEEPKKE